MDTAGSITRPIARKQRVTAHLFHRNTNPTSSVDALAVRSSTAKRIFDTLYTLDALNRLVGAEEGQLAGGVIEAGTRTRTELWNDLSPTGNWRNRRLDANGDARTPYDQELFDDSYAQQSGLSGVGRVSSASVGNRKGYAGYEWDETLSVYHVRHRVYLPEIGRWSRRDPLGYVDGMSLYQYVAGMVVRAVDPSGMITCNPDQMSDVNRRVSVNDEITMLSPCPPGSVFIFVRLCIPNSVMATGCLSTCDIFRRRNEVRADRIHDRCMAAANRSYTSCMSTLGCWPLSRPLTFP